LCYCSRSLASHNHSRNALRRRHHILFALVSRLLSPTSLRPVFASSFLSRLINRVEISPIYIIDSDRRSRPDHGTAADSKAGSALRWPATPATVRCTAINHIITNGQPGTCGAKRIATCGNGRRQTKRIATCGRLRLQSRSPPAA
jgi:hypothetical protein